MSDQVHFTNMESEHLREDMFALALDNRNEGLSASHLPTLTAESLRERSAPGTLLFHEVVTMIEHLDKTMNRTILEHPSVVSNTEFFRLAHHANVALYNCQQALLNAHMDALNADNASQKETDNAE